MTIGIKYCGGCNPRYDRVAKVTAFKAEHPTFEYFSAKAGRHYDYVFVVCGCPAACAEHNKINVKKQIFTLRQDRDWDILYLFFQSQGFI